MNTKLKFDDLKYKSKEIYDSIQEIIGSNILLSMATVNGSNSWINNCYFCYDDRLNIYILTDPKSQHIKNLKNNNSVALTISDSRQDWNGDQKGIQAFGACEPVKALELLDVIKNYTQRFPVFSEYIKRPTDFAKGIISTRFYKIAINNIKLYDTERFGDDEFIEINLKDK